MVYISTMLLEMGVPVANTTPLPPVNSSKYRHFIYRSLDFTIAGAVVDGQLHADFGNGDVTHNARAGNIQRVVVAGKLIRAVKGVFVGGHLCVKGIGGVKVLQLIFSAMMPRRQQIF